jgi:hypothetical protein
MRLATLLSALTASMALVAAPAVLAQSTDTKAQEAKPAAAAKPAPKVAANSDGKATKVEGAAAVRTAPSETKKIAEKNYDGCGHGKVAASDL